MKRKKKDQGLKTVAIMLALLLAGMVAMLILMPHQNRAAMVSSPTLSPAIDLPLEVVDFPDEPEEADDLPARAATYLPVVRRGETERKVIAITVDDCFQPDNLKEIVTLIHRNGGHVTLFPIGENLKKPGVAEVVRGCVYKLGDEVENHTWSHQRIFRLNEDEMAAEIWKQHAALNQVLQANYEQHFFRLMGGDGENDLRTHNYLDQLGYRAIAGWSISGSDADMDMIQSALRPGAVYLFHCTDADTQKLRAFIPYAVQQGYQLVTLNALMGYEDNALTPYTDAAMPAPRPFDEDWATHKQGDYAWNVVRLQDALRGLGMLTMDGPSTGFYGPQTVEAVKQYQSRAGLPVTGEADAETLKRILGV